MKKLQIALLVAAGFSLGYIVGTSKKERKTTPIEKQEQPNAI